MRSRRHSKGGAFAAVCISAVIAGSLLPGGTVCASSSSRLTSFASLLGDKGLKGTKPAESARLQDDAGESTDELAELEGGTRLSPGSGEGSDERLDSFAKLAGQFNTGTKVVSGKTMDKRLLGFAEQVATSGASFGSTHKEDKVIVMNAPAGALWISGPMDLQPKKNVSSTLGSTALSGAISDTAMGTSVVENSRWHINNATSIRWTEDSWDELFPADHMDDGRKLIDIGDYKLTAYCPCEICTGKTDGITKSGTRAVQGRTIAVDPKLLTLGMEVVIDGHVFCAEDTGSAIQGTHIDIFMDSHEQALAFGTKQAEVYLLWEPRKQTDKATNER